MAASRKRLFKQADVTRAVKGVTASGAQVQRVEIDKAGNIVVWTAAPPTAHDDDKLDKELSEFRARHGYS